MDMSEIRRMGMEAISRHLARGLESFGVPEPVKLDAWAEQHFYLSAESSYVEGRWNAWPFQRPIMRWISHDDIREVTFIKSARIGYTKMLNAAIGYFAEHKRRNQALWQPTDDDAIEFVKTELDPMLRDVPIMQSVFPAYLARHKDNTLVQKKFLGSMLHVRGGKAAKNYRRISVDVAFLDELDAFDNDVEKEGDPVTLARKRIEGATFPKLVTGSTPKLKGFSLVEARSQIAEAHFTYRVPCPSCGEFHALEWGGKDDPVGMKWTRGDPDSIRHLCPHCGTLISQGDYLGVWQRGHFASDSGLRYDYDADVFLDAEGNTITAPRHLSVHVWTAYSPSANWPDLARDFIAAHDKAKEGDNSKLKAFWNTTLGRTWEGDIEKTDADELRHRAEPFQLGTVPHGAVLLLAGVDTQDNRLELQVWGYGRGCEMWTVDHKVFFGNPAEDQVWNDLEEALFESEYLHAKSGQRMRIHATAIDSGGHHAGAVYEFARRHKPRRVFAVRGRSATEKHIKDGAGVVDIDWRGRRRKQGVVLWHVGTNHAKDLLHSRLAITRPGPGYVHFSQDLSDEWFRQLAGEARASVDTARGRQSRWTPLRKRVEALDCTVYAMWIEAHLELGRKPARFWADLEERVCPANGSLFDVPERSSSPESDRPAPAPQQVSAAPRRRVGGVHRR